MSAAQSCALSIIIPVFNEFENVEKLYQEIAVALNDYEFQVIFVDDGSTDKTPTLLKQMADRHERLVFIRHKVNAGQSAALVTGAKRAQFPILVTLDGDGQNDPADIPRLVPYLTDNQTIILGNRKKRDDHFLRRLSSRIGNGVRRRILKDGCPDTGCSLKLFPREAFLRIPHFNHMHRYLPALFKRENYRLVNVEVNHRPREFGVSKYGVMNRMFVGIHDLIGMRWLLKRPCVVEVETYEQ